MLLPVLSYIKQKNKETLLGFTTKFLLNVTKIFSRSLREFPKNQKEMSLSFKITQK